MWKMEVPEVPGVPQAASHYSLLTKAGPFLFLAGQIAYDPLTKKVIKNIWDLPEEGRKAIETGRDHTDHREGRIMAQTWYIFNNIKTILEPQGSSIDNILRTTYYFINLDRDFAAMEHTRMLFQKNRLPASTVIEVGCLGVNDDVLIEIECTALIPD